MNALISLPPVVLAPAFAAPGCGSKTPLTDASLRDTCTRRGDEMVMVYLPAASSRRAALSFASGWSRCTRSRWTVSELRAPR